MKKLTTLLLISLLFGISVFGQNARKVEWKSSVKSISADEAEVYLTAIIAAKWHLYSQFTEGTMPLYFQADEKEGYKTNGELKELTPVKKEFEEVFDATTVYWDKKAEFVQKVKLLSNKEVDFTGVIDYQICTEGVCVPESYEFKIVLPAIGNSGATNPSEINEKPDNSVNPTDNSVQLGLNTENQDLEKEIKDSIVSDVTVSNNDKDYEAINREVESIQKISETKSNDLSGENMLTFFLLAFVAGLAAILTPCVFPMIPMTVSFFMHGGEEKSKGKSLAIIFGLSIIIIYTLIGSIVSITMGPDFTHWLSTHWIPNIFFFLIFIIFAASFFGMFELVLPSWMVNRSDKQADKGGYLGAFFMAFTLVLVSFSCTAPIVGTVLILAAEGEFIKPIVGMIGFSLAFALPFTFFAFFPSKLSNLPKSGGWLNSVKVILGFIELALGLKFLSVADQTYHWGILDREVYLALWIVIFTLMGVYLLGKLKFSHDSDVPFLKVPRLAFAIITFAFVVYLIPGMFGAPLKALSGYLPPMSSHDFDFNEIAREESKAQVRRAVSILGTENQLRSFDGVCEEPKYSFLHLPHGLSGYFDLDQAVKCAKEQNKPIFIDFTGHGCVNCREMEANVWSAPDVIAKLSDDYVIVALYTDDKTNLPDDDWILPNDNNQLSRPIKTIGKKNIYFQENSFGMNAQPYYVLLHPDENLSLENRILETPRGYDLDVQEFVHFLDAGINKFNKVNEVIAKY